MENVPCRKSAFRGLALHDLDAPCTASKDSGTNKLRRPSPSVRFQSTDDVRFVDYYDHDAVNPTDRQITPDLTATAHSLSSTSPLPVDNMSMVSRLGLITLLLAAVLPLLHNTDILGHASLPLQPVSAGPIRAPSVPHGSMILVQRGDTPVDVCFRWAQQSAIVNGTLYLYGGQATDDPAQTQNTWTNNFLSLDLTKDWQISSPALTGLSQPSGPPNVSLGYLWNSHQSLWLYGGEFSSEPWESPAPLSTWEYDILGQSWKEHSNPETSSGTNAPSNNDPVQRAAEGAGISVPSLGRGFYFGGHLDPFTTPGWAQWIPRVYLQSLLEFTMPGYTNDQVEALGSGKEAGTDGNYRNITTGGLQSQAGFTQRADGLLIYVPGFGEQGILLALAGGTNETFTQMNNINVYDIANSSWYTQATSGPTPNIRVNPCAVIAAAPDGSSYNIYMFGGQNLIPAGNQTQYDDMWILTLPSFTWIAVNQSGQSVPYGRSGHTCNIWDGQMVMSGGYVGDNMLSCESPGIYVFDLSNLQWVNQFTALSPATPSSSASDGSNQNPTSVASSSPSASSSSSNSPINSTGSSNPFNQQPAQIFNATYPGGLEGSYGYQVPDVVASVVGGGSMGGATVTVPAQTATAGPFATGKPITYTITGSNGAVTTETTTPGSNPGGGNSGNGHHGPNIAAIVVGVIAGLLFLLACYLAFCAYVYRKQLQLYKRHVEMAQRQARGEKVPAIPGLLATDSSTNTSMERKRQQQHQQHMSLENPWAISQSETSSSQGQRTATTGTGGYASVRRTSEGSDSEDLLAGTEPTFVGVMLNPRRSLRVINRD